MPAGERELVHIVKCHRNTGQSHHHSALGASGLMRMFKKDSWTCGNRAQVSQKKSASLKDNSTSEHESRLGTDAQISIREALDYKNMRSGPRPRIAGAEVGIGYGFAYPGDLEAVSLQTAHVGAQWPMKVSD